MEKIKNKIALTLVRFGVWIYDTGYGEVWDDEDLEYVRKLWDLHDELTGRKASSLRTDSGNTKDVKDE